MGGRCNVFWYGENVSKPRNCPVGNAGGGADSLFLDAFRRHSAAQALCVDSRKPRMPLRQLIGFCLPAPARRRRFYGLSLRESVNRRGPFYKDYALPCRRTVERWIGPQLWLSLATGRMDEW